MFEKYIHEDIEQSLLSKFMDNPKELYNCPDLTVDDFVYDEHKKIFNAIVELNNNGIPVNPKNIFDITGNKDYVCKLMGIVSSSPVNELANYLIDETEKYNTLVNIEQLVKDANDDKNVDLFAKLSELSFKKDKMFEECSNEKMLKELEERMKGGNLGISTSILGLDDSINAFQKGRLYIVGARPSMGKSAFMCSLCEKIEKNNKVGILSLEMNTSELKQRIACIRGNIKHWKIEKGRCNDEEFEAYAKSLGSIKNIVINDKGGLNRYQAIALIRNMVLKMKCGIIFIDHIGLLKVNGNSNLSHEIGENTSALKALAKELQIPIVCLCQLNRAVEKEKSKEPTLADLRDSGRIEEDADCVILLYRENYYNQELDGRAKYLVAKCRNGKTGMVAGYFDNELMKWS